MNDTDRFDFDELDAAIRAAVIAADDCDAPDIFALADAYTPHAAEKSRSSFDVLRDVFYIAAEPVKTTRSTIERAVTPIKSEMNVINRMRSALSQTAGILNGCFRIADAAITLKA
jgi:hypothetical protein